MRKRSPHRDHIRDNWNYKAKIFGRYLYYVEDYRYECVKCGREPSISMPRLSAISEFLSLYNSSTYGGFKESLPMSTMGSYL